MSAPESEAIERAALEDVHAAAGEDDTLDPGLKGISLGPAFLSMATRLADCAVVVNRAFVLGLGADSSGSLLNMIAMPSVGARARGEVTRRTRAPRS